MLTPEVADEALQIGERVDVEVGDVLPEAGRVGVDQRHDAKPPGAEAAVVGQRMSEVADTHDDDGPVLGQAE